MIQRGHGLSRLIKHSRQTASSMNRWEVSNRCLSSTRLPRNHFRSCRLEGVLEFAEPNGFSVRSNIWNSKMLGNSLHEEFLSRGVREAGPVVKMEWRRRGPRPPNTKAEVGDDGSMVRGDELSAVQYRGRPDGSDPPGRNKYVVETDLSGAVVTGEGVQFCVASGFPPE